MKMKLLEDCGLGVRGDVVEIETADEANHLVSHHQAEPVVETKTATRKKATSKKAATRQTRAK